MLNKIKNILQNAINEIDEVIQEQEIENNYYKGFANLSDERKNMLENYFLIRRDLLINKIDEIRLRSHMKDSLSREAFLREFGTLRLDFGRQTGNSYFIHKLDEGIARAEKIPSICTIFYRWNTKNYHRLKYISSFTKGEVLNNPSNIGDYQTVIVDNSIIYTKEELDEIYLRCGMGETQLIILT